MLTTALLLLRSSLFLSLHLAGNSGSFPRPLSAQEEQECLQRCAEGDLEARNTLVEHNMRLVAHIIKKGYPSRREFLGDFQKSQYLLLLKAQTMCPLRETLRTEKKYNLPRVHNEGEAA